MRLQKMNNSSRHFISLTIFATLSLTLLATSRAYAAPNGAKKLPEERLFALEDFSCGFNKNRWTPGRIIKRGFFYPLAAERKNIAKKAKAASGRKKQKLQKKAKRLKRLIKERNTKCTDTGATRPIPPPILGRRALRFNFSGAVGLAIADSNARLRSAKGVTSLDDSGSNMLVVGADGSTQEALKSGKATISRFLIAPNNKLYVLFNQKVNLRDTTQPSPNGCLLAEVDTTSGLPTCIDNSLKHIKWLEKPANNPIQFDAEGAIYYLGSTKAGATVLRKHGTSGILDLINQNVRIDDYLVLSDGSVILYGSTGNTDASWIRKVTVSGGLQSISNIQRCNSMLRFMKIFPDGKLYFGIDDCNLFGVYSMDPSSQSFDERPWFGWNSRNGVSLPEPVKHECSPQHNDLENWSRCGVEVSEIITTPSQEVFGITTIGYSVTRKALIQYFGDYSRPNLSVTAIRVFQAVLSSVIAAGLNSSGQNILTLFDTSDNSELELIGPDNEIEIYHLNYVASTNRIMFDGLRFSDNKYVIGQYDLNSMTFSASQTGSTKLVDFQTF